MCPDCNAEVDVPEDALQGEIVACPDCGLELEVKNIDAGKVELKEVVVEKEDWGE